MPRLPSDREWIYWGEHDPLYAVVTRADRDLGGAKPWTPEEFLETGRRYFEAVALHWRRYGMGSRHCVEIGCGAGRITAQLARCFGAVTALDVSSAQLAHARTLIGDAWGRVNFQLVEAPEIPLPVDSCDGVFSCEVFQHFDSDTGLRAYAAEAFRVLESQGTICFQVPLAGMQRRSLLASPLRNALLRLLRRWGRRRMMIYRLYRADEVLQMLTQFGFVAVELQVFQAAEQEGFHAYFMAKKP
jgi:ubiquinone/menaquinone biosynthesis C-methylase UbiE